MNPRDLLGACNPEPRMCDRPRLMLTLRCTRRCFYCTIKPHVPTTWYLELSALEWRDRIQELMDDGAGTPILSGREPTLHPEFLRVIELLPEAARPATVYSNLDARLPWETVDPQAVNWAVTLHRNASAENTQRFATHVLALRAGKHQVKLDTLGLSPQNRQVLEDAGVVIPIYQKPWVDLPRPPREPVRCFYTVRWFGPDGRRWWCTSKLLRGDRAFLVNDALGRADGDSVVCPEPTCNACDWWFVRVLKSLP